MQGPDIKEELDLRLQEIIDSHVSSLSADFRRLIGELPLQVEAEEKDSGERQARAMADLKTSVEAIHAASGQRAMAHRLLDATSRQAARSALFLTRGEACIGFEARGFPENESGFDQISFAPGGDDPLGGALSRQETMHLHGSSLDSSVLAPWLGDTRPQQVCLAPVVVGGKTVALLYADSGSEDDQAGIHPESVEILASVAGMFLERLRRPADDSRTGPENAAMETARPASPTPSVSDSGDEDETVPLSDQDGGDETDMDSGRADMAADTGTAPGLDAQAGSLDEDDLAATQVMVGGEDPAPAFDPTATVALSDEAHPDPATAAPEADSAPTASPAAEQDLDSQAEEDARRFARLLVSEIVLYNEAQVKAGRKNADLLSRLKDPIQRSRAAYEERFGAATLSFFDEEIVRVLAAGDRQLLGLTSS